MARGKFITKFEAEIIRIGVDRGFKAPQIARYLGRTKQAVYAHIEKMQADDTLANLPFDFVADEIAGGIRDKG